MKNPRDPDHYLTFLEAAALSPDVLAYPDQYQPSVVANNLGRCRICPSYVFTSAAEKARHLSNVHDITKGKAKKLDFGGAGGADKAVLRWECKYKSKNARGVVTTTCSRRFKTRRRLTEHQDATGHKVRGIAAAARAHAAADTSGDEAGEYQEEDEQQEG